MTLTSEEIDAIIFYRRQKSYATLQEANDAMKDAHWNLTIQPAQSHNGVVGQIGLHFVTTGRLSKEYGRLYSRLLQSRISGDYNDFFDFTEEDVNSFMQPTRELIKRLEELIEQD